MSVRVMSAVWEAELPAFEKLVLLALADCANDAIKHAPTGRDAKRRIMLARTLGLLDDDETEEWIAMYGVKHD